MIDIGLKIKEMRESMGLSIRQLALSTDIAASYVGDIEKGKSSPSIDKLIKICDYFGITLQEFLNEESKNGNTLLNPEQRKLLDTVKNFSPEKLSKLAELVQLLNN